MLELNLRGLSDPGWSRIGVALPGFDLNKMKERTQSEPKWLHFGAGNIFRAFPAAVLHELLEKGEADTGLVAVEGFDEEVIEKVYRPHDNLSLLVTMRSDGTMKKKIIASVGEALTLQREGTDGFQRVAEIFRKDSLQMVSFTITEKGYALKNGSGTYFEQIAADFDAGPSDCQSYMAKVTALCYGRFLAGELPLALVSMDNFSHNGDKLKSAVLTFAKGWAARNLVLPEFLAYLQDPQKVSYPWTMIDKITPRPDSRVNAALEDDGIAGMKPVITAKHTYIAPFVNAESCQYLVIEDHFPAGRPALEKAGLIFTTREIVDRVERMKVCTCLNPLHTALAIFGCLLSYEKIYEEMQDPLLKKLVVGLGYGEGLPVVTDPGIIEPERFIEEVLTERIPNPCLPDTPQRIATDTSQKLAIRFGETIKAYLRAEQTHVSELRLIPLVFAGWCRYLMGIDDSGRPFIVSPDPLYDQLKIHVADIHLGDTGPFSDKLQPILSDAQIFGVNLYDVGLGALTESYFTRMVQGSGAVREVLSEVVGDWSDKDGKTI